MPEQIPHYRYVDVTDTRHPRGRQLVKLPDRVDPDGPQTITQNASLVIASVVAANEEHARERLDHFYGDLGRFEFEQRNGTTWL